MQRIFWVTCPGCGKAFSVDYGIRHEAVQLECPYDRPKFTVDEAAAIDERWG